MSTFKELSQDPLMNADLMEVLTASPDAAADVAKRLSALPQVGQARTIDTFVPEGQAGKIVAVKSTADKTRWRLEPVERPAARTNADNIEALKSGTQNLLLLADAVPVQAAMRQSVLPPISTSLRPGCRPCERQCRQP